MKSHLTYDGGQMLLTVDDHGVERALGALARKTPAVLKVAINRTARQARKDLIEEAEKRYALTSRGKAKLRELKQRQTATNTRLMAELRQNDEGLMLNASYFRHTPTVPRMGLAVFRSPAFHRVQTLRGGPMEELTESENETERKGKGFLIRVYNPRVKNTHLMIANRILGSDGGETRTRTGKRRWRIKGGSVEKAPDVNRIGASSQQRAVWYRGVDQKAAENLKRFTRERTIEVLE